MRTKDPIVEQLVKDRIPVKLEGHLFIVERNPIGSCDDCYFFEKQCPKRAITICCSNGGNIFKLLEQNK